MPIVITRHYFKKILNKQTKDRENYKRLFGGYKTPIIRIYVWVHKINESMREFVHQNQTFNPALVA